MTRTTQPPGIQLPYTLTFNPDTTEIEVRGHFDVDPYDVVEGYTSPRTVRITNTVISVTFKAGREPYLRVSGAGRQVRKDGSLGRDVVGTSIYLTDIQRETALDIARNVVRKSVDAALGSE